MPRIIDLLKNESTITEQIIELSKCHMVAIAPISTSSRKTVYVTDNGRCFTHGRLWNRESLTENHSKNRYGRIVFLFGKNTTTRTIFGAAELIYSAFNGIDYEEMKKVSFRDRNPMNVRLENLYLKELKICGSKSMEKYSLEYKKNHARLSCSLRYFLNEKIDIDKCRDIVSDIFFWLCMKFDNETQVNDFDFVSVWFYWCKKESMKYLKRKDKLIMFDDVHVVPCYQDPSWEIYYLIDKYIQNKKYNNIAKMMAMGYTNEDLCDELGVSMVEANNNRTVVMRKLRSKLIVKNKSHGKP